MTLDSKHPHCTLHESATEKIRSDAEYLHLNDPAYRSLGGVGAAIRVTGDGIAAGREGYTIPAWRPNVGFVKEGCVNVFLFNIGKAVFPIAELEAI